MQVGGYALSLHLIGLVGDADREHIRASHDRVNLDPTTVEAARPAAIGAIQFEPIALAIDGDVVRHKNQSSVSDQ